MKNTQHQGRRSPASERVPSWLLVMCAPWNKSCKQELKRRNDAFRARAQWMHKMGAKGQALLSQIARLYHVGILMIFSCFAVIGLGVVDALVNDRFTFIALIPIGMMATWIFMIVMDRSLEKLWNQIGHFIDPDSALHSRRGL